MVIGSLVDLPVRNLLLVLWPLLRFPVFVCPEIVKRVKRNFPDNVYYLSR